MCGVRLVLGGSLSVVVCCHAGPYPTHPRPHPRVGAYDGGLRVPDRLGLFTEVSGVVGLGIAMVAVLVVVLGAVAWGAAAASRRVRTREDRVDQHEEQRTLRYRVPPGGDVAVLIAALDRAGYVAALDAQDDVVSIAVASDEDRDRVRGVIAGASGGEHRAVLPGQPVVFADER